MTYKYYSYSKVLVYLFFIPQASVDHTPWSCTSPTILFRRPFHLILHLVAVYGRSLLESGKYESAWRSSSNLEKNSISIHWLYYQKIYPLDELWVGWDSLLVREHSRWAADSVRKHAQVLQFLQGIREFRIYFFTIRSNLSYFSRITLAFTALGTTTARKPFFSQICSVWDDLFEKYLEMIYNQLKISDLSRYCQACSHHPVSYRWRRSCWWSGREWHRSASTSTRSIAVGPLIYYSSQWAASCLRKGISISSLIFFFVYVFTCVNYPAIITAAAMCTMLRVTYIRSMLEKAMAACWAPSSAHSTTISSLSCAIASYGCSSVINISNTASPSSLRMVRDFIKNISCNFLRYPPFFRQRGSVECWASSLHHPRGVWSLQRFCMAPHNLWRLRNNLWSGQKSVTRVTTF